MKVLPFGWCGAVGSRGSVFQAVALVLMIFAVSHLIVVPLASAQSKEEGGSESTGSQAGMGAASFFVNILYMPTKLVYAILGGIVGGFAYGLSGGDDKVAKKVWDTSMRGTYVITPDHLRGDKPVRFLGVPQEEEEAEAAPTR